MIGVHPRRTGCRPWWCPSGRRRQRCRRRRKSSMSTRLVRGVHLQQAADALVLALGRVEHVGVRQSSWPEDHAQVRELADEGVGHDLEGQRREGSLRVGGDGSSSSPVSGLVPLMAGTSPGARQVNRQRRRGAPARPCSCRTEPTKTGWILQAIAPLRMSGLELVDGERLRP